MAQLVKFSTEPHKYFAERRENFWPLNLIISEENYKFKKNFERRNSAFKKNISKILREYTEKIPKEITLAKARGSIIKRQRTVGDIIMLAAIWHSNIEREIEAIITLSKSISELIINTEINNINTESLRYFLRDNLRNFFHISIYVPEQIYNNLPTHKSLEYFSQEKKTELKIFINNEEQIIDLSGLDIRRTIERSIKNII